MLSDNITIEKDSADFEKQMFHIRAVVVNLMDYTYGTEVDFETKRRFTDRVQYLTLRAR